MEVEHGGLEDDFSLQGGHFPLNHDYGRKGIHFYDPSSHNHGSVENGCISNISFLLIR